MTHAHVHTHVAIMCINWYFNTNELKLSFHLHKNALTAKMILVLLFNPILTEFPHGNAAAPAQSPRYLAREFWLLNVSLG